MRLAGPLAPGKPPKRRPPAQRARLARLLNLRARSQPLVPTDKSCFSASSPVFQNGVIETDEDGAVGLDLLRVHVLAWRLRPDGSYDMVYAPVVKRTQWGSPWSLVRLPLSAVRSQNQIPTQWLSRRLSRQLNSRYFLAGKIGGEGEENSFSSLLTLAGQLVKLYSPTTGVLLF